MTGYSKTPLLKKLGIKKTSQVVFLQGSKEILQLLKPESSRFATKLMGEFDYIHIFSMSEDNLKTRFTEAVKFLKPNGLLWVSWPKSGKLGTNLNENKVRDIGLALGLVDVKIAAINDTWSGLKFVYRLKDRKHLV